MIAVTVALATSPAHAATAKVPIIKSRWVSATQLAYLGVATEQPGRRRRDGVLTHNARRSGFRGQLLSIQLSNPAPGSYPRAEHSALTGGLGVGRPGIEPRTR